MLRSLWPALRKQLAELTEAIRVGDVADFRNFMGAVIDERAFDRITGHIEDARRTATVLTGGTYDKGTGYFITPTLQFLANYARDVAVENGFREENRFNLRLLTLF